MELREYLAVRRAYNLVRQQHSADERLTFVELAILCRLYANQAELTTSQIAEYQGALRPTMTHRTKHLADMGFLERVQGSRDRRNVVCRATDEGRAYAEEACSRISQVLRTGNVLSRTNGPRICRYVDAMGSVRCMSSELVLLGIYSSPDACSTVGELVGRLGLLQPTVSMSMATLMSQKLVQRASAAKRVARSTPIELTEAGRTYSQELADAIGMLVVRRG